MLEKLQGMWQLFSSLTVGSALFLLLNLRGLNLIMTRDSQAEYSSCLQIQPLPGVAVCLCQNSKFLDNFLEQIDLSCPSPTVGIQEIIACIICLKTKEFFRRLNGVFRKKSYFIK